MSISTLKTGDIVLCSGRHFWFSDLIEIATHSPWSHCGVIYKDDTGVYLMESGLEHNQGKPVLGVQLTDFKLYTLTYDGELWILPLNTLSQTEEGELYSHFQQVLGKKYDTNPLDFLRAWFDLDVGNTTSTDHFFCSALVAYLLNSIGVIQSVKWDLIKPDDIQNLPLTQNYSYGPLWQLPTKDWFK
jgi:hypothetical protein